MKWTKLMIICAIFISCISCGITKATISKPATGTITTVTITTANPMTTSVSPNTDFNYKKGEQQQ